MARQQRGISLPEEMWELLQKESAYKYGTHKKVSLIIEKILNEELSELLDNPHKQKVLDMTKEIGDIAADVGEQLFALVGGGRLLDGAKKDLERSVAHGIFDEEEAARRFEIIRNRVMSVADLQEDKELERRKARKLDRKRRKRKTQR